MGKKKQDKNHSLRYAYYDQRDVMGELPDGLQVSPDDLVQLFGDRGTIDQGSLSEVL
jgi:hypothetical protein